MEIEQTDPQPICRNSTTSPMQFGDEGFLLEFPVARTPVKSRAGEEQRSRASYRRIGRACHLR
jgi:hypothetical protein